MSRTIQGFLMNEDELRRGIEQYVASQKRLARKHASFFYSGRTYEGIDEITIAEEFVPTFEAIFGLQVNNIIPGNDPPDIAFDVGGSKKFAIELTELVNQEAITAQIRNEHARYAQEQLNWNSHNTCERIECILWKKQKGAQKVSHLYERYIVLLHTDETMLVSNRVANYTSEHSWPAYPHIDDAYVISSYEPGKGYPVVKLFGT